MTNLTPKTIQNVHKISFGIGYHHNSSKLSGKLLEVAPHSRYQFVTLRVQLYIFVENMRVLTINQQFDPTLMQEITKIRFGIGYSDNSSN